MHLPGRVHRADWLLDFLGTLPDLKMSTDSAGEVDTAPTKLEHPIFRSQGGDPIRLNSNLATINGIMFEIENP